MADLKKKRMLTDKIFKIIFLIFISLGLIVLAALIYDIVSKGMIMLDWEFFTRFDSRFPEKAGIKAGLFGTIYVIGLMIPITFFVGTATAIYLEEYAPNNKLIDLINPMNWIEFFYKIKTTP